MSLGASASPQGLKSNAPSPHAPLSSATSSSSQTPPPNGKKLKQQRAPTAQKSKTAVTNDAMAHADAVCAVPVTVQWSDNESIDNFCYRMKPETTVRGNGLVYHQIKFNDVESVKLFQSRITNGSGNNAQHHTPTSDVRAAYTTSMNPLLHMNQQSLLNSHLVYVAADFDKEGDDDEEDVRGSDCNDAENLAVLLRSLDAMTSLASIWLQNRKSNPLDVGLHAYPFQQVYAVLFKPNGKIGGLLVSFDGQSIADAIGDDAYLAMVSDRNKTLARDLTSALLHLHCSGIVHNAIGNDTVMLSSKAERILVLEVLSNYSGKSSKFDDEENGQFESMTGRRVALSPRLAMFCNSTRLYLAKGEMAIGSNRPLPTYPKAARDANEGSNFAFKSPELLLRDDALFNPRMCDVYAMGMVIAIYMANVVRCLDKESVDPFFISNMAPNAAVHDIASAWGASSFHPRWTYPFEADDSYDGDWLSKHAGNPFLFERWVADEVGFKTLSMKLVGGSSYNPPLPYSFVFAPEPNHAAFEYEAAALMNAHHISPLVLTQDEQDASFTAPGSIIPSMFHFYSFVHSLETVCHQTGADVEMVILNLMQCPDIPIDEQNDNAFINAINAFIGHTRPLFQILDGERPGVTGSYDDMTAAPVAFVGGASRALRRVVSRNRSMTLLTVPWWQSALDMLKHENDSVLDYIDDDAAIAFIRQLMDSISSTVTKMIIVNSATHPNPEMRCNALELFCLAASSKVDDGARFGTYRFNQSTRAMARNAEHVFTHLPPTSELHSSLESIFSVCAFFSDEEDVPSIRTLAESVSCFRRLNTIMPQSIDIMDLGFRLAACFTVINSVHGGVANLREIMKRFEAWLRPFIVNDGKDLNNDALLQHISSRDSVASFVETLLPSAERQHRVNRSSSVARLDDIPVWIFKSSSSEAGAVSAELDGVKLSKKASGGRRASLDDARVGEKLDVAHAQEEGEEDGERLDDDLEEEEEDEFDDDEDVESNGGTDLNRDWLTLPSHADSILLEWIAQKRGESLRRTEFGDEEEEEDHEGEEDEVDNAILDSERDYPDLQLTKLDAPTHDGVNSSSPAAEIDAFDGIIAAVLHSISFATVDSRSTMWMLAEQSSTSPSMLVAAFHAFIHNKLDTPEQLAEFVAQHESVAPSSPQ